MLHVKDRHKETDKRCTRAQTCWNVNITIWENDDEMTHKVLYAISEAQTQTIDLRGRTNGMHKCCMAAVGAPCEELQSWRLKLESDPPPSTQGNSSHFDMK